MTFYDDYITVDLIRVNQIYNAENKILNYYCWM